jgi:hypothetical protein
MKITASKLRQDIYRLLDEVLRSGKPLEIERNGEILRIVPDKPRRGKLDRLKKRKYSDEDPDTFTHLNWSRVVLSWHMPRATRLI